MALTVPRHLREANIQNPATRYEWDDWRDLPALEEIDQEVSERLEKMSQRAVLAFMCGTAEWLVYRFSALVDDPAPSAFLEAAWAMLVDVHYGEGGGATSWESIKESTADWSGPVKGPIADGLLRLEVALHRLQQDGTDPVGRA